VLRQAELASAAGFFLATRAGSLRCCELLVFSRCVRSLVSKTVSAVGRKEFVRSTPVSGAGVEMIAFVRA
jgi:hypothetical protein